jgi:hypothetical protein
MSASGTKVYARGSFCDPAKCTELECEEKEEEGPSPAVVAACAGGGTVAVLLLGLGVWYAVRKRVNCVRPDENGYWLVRWDNQVYRRRAGSAQLYRRRAGSARSVGPD